MLTLCCCPKYLYVHVYTQWSLQPWHLDKDVLQHGTRCRQSLLIDAMCPSSLASPRRRSMCQSPHSPVVITIIYITIIVFYFIFTLAVTVDDEAILQVNDLHGSWISTMQGVPQTWEVTEFTKTIFQARKLPENNTDHGKSWKSDEKRL